MGNQTNLNVRYLATFGKWHKRYINITFMNSTVCLWANSKVVSGTSYYSCKYDDDYSNGRDDDNEDGDDDEDDDDVDDEEDKMLMMMRRRMKIGWWW